MKRSLSRPGTIVPLTALLLVILLAFVALALDLGLVMIARNQAQNAADAAAMAGARTLNGDPTTDNNFANAEPNGRTAAKANSILNTAVTDSQVTVTIGDYYYDTGSSSFQMNPTGRQTGNNWTLAQATVTASPPTAFGEVLGMGPFNVTARATAAHRPRDIAIVIDFSGSMRFESMLASPHSGSRTVSMNPDTVYPTWGHYNGNSSLLTWASNTTVANGEVISAGNVSTTTTFALDAVIGKFYADTTAFGTSVPAFTSAASTYGTTPNGDVPLRANKGTTGASWAQSVSEYVYNNTTSTGPDWRYELDGHAAYSGGLTNATTDAATDYAGTTFNGYSQGPGYWGKTFFNWPPDPRQQLTTTTPLGATSGPYTASTLRDAVKNMLLVSGFGYTNADFANTSVTTAFNFPSASNPSTVKTMYASASNFPPAPFKVMVGNLSGGAFSTTPTPEVVNVTNVSGANWTVARGQDGTTQLPVATTNPSSTFTTSATSITVASISGFPTAVPFKIMVGTASSGLFSGTTELMTVTARGGTGSRTWTVTRAVNGTTRVAGTTTMTVALAYDVGLLTAPPLNGLYTTASTNLGATVGTAPTTANVWTGWSASTLGSYMTANVYRPGTNSGANAKLAATDTYYRQVLRLYNRVGTGMPKDGSNNPVPADWRSRFFLTTSGAPLTDVRQLFDTSGSMRVPRDSSGNNYYRINYTAILDWIKNSGPNPFPNQLRAGGIIYYSSIPSTIATNVFPPADPNQRFWKEYIDEVLGVRQTSLSSGSPVYSNVATRNGYGEDFTWSAAAVSSSQPSTHAYTYTDRPKRPKLRTWFGPLSMIDFIGNYNGTDSTSAGARLWWPGTVPEAPMYQTKLAIQAVLKDVSLNHPNDNVAMIYFSSPRTTTGSGYYNTARAPLSRDPRRGINALWFSPKVIDTNAEISVYDSTGTNTGDIYDVPRANGGTCYSMPLMLAYNQFSTNSSLVNHTANATAGTAGGLGRNGASKLLVFETDGMVNTGVTATLVSSANGSGYYQVRVADASNVADTANEYPTAVAGPPTPTFTQLATAVQGIASQICANQADGGFSTTRKPVKIHCIAFGALFDSTNTSTAKTNALSNLAAMEVIGKVQSAGASTLASNKIIVGDYNTRIDNLQAAFSGIMQDGVQVTLISSGTGQP